MMTIKIDDRDFNRAFLKYIDFNHRSLREIVLQKSYWLSRRAFYQTEHETAAHIESELKKPSQINPKAPLWAILLNKSRKAQNLPHLTGDALKDAGEKFIKKKRSSANSNRAGWIPPIRKFEPLVRSKSSVVRVRESKPKGGAILPDNSWNPKGVLWNAVLGGKGMPGIRNRKGTAQPVIARGLQKALQIETNSMYKYINDHLEKGASEFNRS